MALFGGIELVGRPDLENVRRLDLLPMKSIGEMMRYGMAIDIPHLKLISERLADEMSELRTEICLEIPPEKLDEFIARSNMDAEDDYLPMNVDSVQQIRRLLFEVLGVGRGHKLKLTKGGDVSTGKRQLEQRKKDHPIVPKVLAYREKAKLKNTYSDTLPRIARFHPEKNCWCGLRHFAETWRVHCDIMTTRSSTGRPITRRPNLQNLPIRSKTGQSIRRGFVASPGTELVTVDLAQIELRLLAHLAGASMMIQAFHNNEDLHTRTAMLAFDEKDPTRIDPITQRAPAKNVNFAICIAEGQLVLTDLGLIPIEKIKCCHKVWDGVEFVNHQGIIDQGFKEVITYEGLTATPTHKIWIEGKSRPIPISQAMAQRSRLVTSAIGDSPVRIVEDSIQVDSFIQQDWKSSSSMGPVFGLQKKSRSVDRQYSCWENTGLHLSSRSKVQRSTRQSSLRKTYRYCSTLFKSKLRQLAQLWRSWYREQVCRCPTFCQLYIGELATPDLPWDRYRSYRQQWTLSTGKSLFRNTQKESAEHATECDRQLQGRGYDSDRDGGTNDERIPAIQVSQDTGCPTSLLGNPVERNSQSQTKRTISKVYDIMDAGPRRRFTVSGKLVSNCYGETPKGLYEQLLSDTYGKSGIPVPDWLTLEWCEEFMIKWFGIYPEVMEYMQTQWYKARRYGLVWTMMGRIRRIPEVRSVHSRVQAAGERQAGNQPIQGWAADLLKLIQAEIQEWIEKVMRPEGIWVWPLNEVHDELIYEVELGWGQVLLNKALDVMENGLRDKESGEWMCRVPIKAEGKVLDRWEK